MKKFFEEFKAFALKGNMMDMAIGVIIGGAFSTLVTSLTDNLISPILGILGKVNFDAMMWDVFGDGKLVFKYGAFITAVINFLIMAFVLFCIVKAMNKLMEMGKHEEPAAEEPAAPAAPAPQPVDPMTAIERIAQQKGNPPLNWRTSIVDLMKLLDLDSSLDNRKELATELGYTGAKDGSAEMNIWLHAAVLRELGKAGGQVPETLKD